MLLVLLLADAKAFSKDAGRTWTKLVNMTAVGGGLVGTAKPRGCQFKIYFGMSSHMGPV